MNNDIHSQTARELFGDDSPAFRRLAKDINFTRLYSGRDVPVDAKLFPHQEEMLAKAREMSHRAWPGLARFAPGTGKTADALPVAEPTLRGEVEYLDETAIIRGCGGVRGNIEIAIADYLSRGL